MEAFIQAEMKETGTIAAKEREWESRYWPCVLSIAACWRGFFRNINIPWPTQGMGDGDYLYAFQEVVMPIGYEFDPDLVISAFVST